MLQGSTIPIFLAAQSPPRVMDRAGAREAHARGFLHRSRRQAWKAASTSPRRTAPIALVLHPHPQFGGTMNNKIVDHLYYAFAERGVSALRFNFRGVGRSLGTFDYGAGELSDAAAALDRAQAANPTARACGSRASLPAHGSRCNCSCAVPRSRVSSRPPRQRIVTTSAFSRPARAPACSSMAISPGGAWLKEVLALIEKLKTHKGAVIEHAVAQGANHFFENKIEPLISAADAYLDRRLDDPMCVAIQRGRIKLSRHGAWLPAPSRFRNFRTQTEQTPSESGRAIRARDPCLIR